jgi:hypothetical protein
LYDASFSQPAFAIIRDKRWQWLHSVYRTAENHLRLLWLYMMIALAMFVMPDGWCFWRQGGNASGQGNTTPDNTIKGCIDVFWLWCVLVPDHMAWARTYYHFKRWVRMKVNGDDWMFSVHPCCLPFFNAKSISSVSHRIGMKFEFESMEPKWPWELTFLGHKFNRCRVPHFGENMWFPHPSDCQKPRDSLLCFNTEHSSEVKRLAITIQRACGLRNETFMCEGPNGCRLYFSLFIEYLRSVTSSRKEPEIRDAWKSWHSDHELYELYSGVVMEHTCGDRESPSARSI